MSDVYFFEFENVTVYYRQYSQGWMAYLPNSGTSQTQLLLTLSRAIANWRDAGCPPSGYPKGAMESLESEPSEQVLMRHPLEICEPYERSAIARLLKVHDIDQVLYLVERSILEPEAAQAFRESRMSYRGLAKMMLLQAAFDYPSAAASEHVEISGRAIAERFTVSYFSTELQPTQVVHLSN